jgi:hydrogenase expression/formation protein HypE
MLGIDPLEVANEGKVVLAVHPQRAQEVLHLLRSHPFGSDAQVIGQVEDAQDGQCELVTLLGGRRLIQKPYGEQLPRIC